MKRTVAVLLLTALLGGGVAACGNSTAGSPPAHPTRTSSRTTGGPSISAGTARGPHHAADEEFLRALRRMPGWSATWEHGRHLEDWHPRTALQHQQVLRLCRDELARGTDPRLRRMASYLMHDTHDSHDVREMHRLMRDLNG